MLPRVFGLSAREAASYPALSVVLILHAVLHFVWAVWCVEGYVRGEVCMLKGVGYLATPPRSLAELLHSSCWLS